MMYLRARSFLCIGLLFLVSATSIFASEKTLHILIKPGSETIQKLRYQRGSLPKNSWKNAPLPVSPIELKEFASETEFLFVQQASADGVWGKIYAFQYNMQEKIWPITGFISKGPLDFRIRVVDDSINMVRYQEGKEPDNLWKTTDSSGSSLRIEEFDSVKEFLFVQQAAVADKWSDTYAYQYDYLGESWSKLPPKQEKKASKQKSLDLKAYVLGPVGCTTNFYSYLLGGGIQANISLGNFLGYSGITFSKGPPNSAWVKSQQALAFSVGLGYTFPLSESFELIPEVGYGVIFHILEADFDKDATYNLEVFIDQQVRLALYLTYALNEKHTFFIAPLGVIFFEKNNYGIMYGCQAGLRISL